MPIPARSGRQSAIESHWRVPSERLSSLGSIDKKRLQDPVRRSLFSDKPSGESYTQFGNWQKTCLPFESFREAHNQLPSRNILAVTDQKRLVSSSRMIDATCQKEG